MRMLNTSALSLCIALAISILCPSALRAQVAVIGETVHTMSGASIENAVVIIKEGKITAIGPVGEVVVPSGFEVIKARVVTPGLIDAHSTVGLSGILNIDHDQDQLEDSEPIQPELRALDAYNASDDLVSWIRSFGVTTIHTGHAPGELISGQTLITKTIGNTVNDNLLVDECAVAATLTSSARKSAGKSPGTRGKMVAMLRNNLIKAREYLDKQEQGSESDADVDADADDDSDDGDDNEAAGPDRDLRMETLGQVLRGELKLMITADRAQDIASALRLAEEFGFQLWLDGAAESYRLVDEIKAAGVPVLIHPTMQRSVGDRENLSFETASKLMAAGIPVAFQSGYESYVPKTRVVLFEAAMAAANGLTFDQALGGITIEAAKILGIDDRVGSIEIGKDGDVALFDGDPFEYTSHCVGVVINGQVVSRVKR